jgi:MYXO-CTERM domain-containing protein
MHVLVATAHDASGNVATATATVTVPGASVGGGNGEQPGSNDDLPACSLDTGGRGPRGLLPIGLAVAFVLRRRKWTRDGVTGGLSRG